MAREPSPTDSFDALLAAGEALSESVYESIQPAAPRIFQQLFETLPTAAWILSEDPLHPTVHTLLHANTKAEELTGWTRGELARHGWQLLLGEAVRQPSFEPIRRAVLEERATSGHFLVERRDLSTFWAELKWVPLQAGKVTTAWAVFLEQTDTHHNHDWLQAREIEQLHGALESLQQGIITLNADAQVAFLNQAACVMTGWSAEEARQKPFQKVIRLVDEFRRPLDMDPIEQVFDSGQQWQLPTGTRLESRTRSLRTVQMTAQPIFDHRRRVVGATISLQDNVSATPPRPAQAKAPRQILPQGIAHDFKNILTGILGNLSLLQAAEDTSASSREVLERAERAVRRAQALTRQLSQSSRSSRAKRAPVELHQLIHESVGFIVNASNCRAHLDIDEDLPLALVDEDQFNQVLNNLLLNAVQAMPRGGLIAVRARCESIPANRVPPLDAGDYLVLEVEDAGPGIPAEVLPNIFDAYFTTKKDGNGLGLANCYTIMRNNGGLITARSEPECGACFTCYLQIAQGAESPARTIAPQVPRKAALTHGHVLVVDDEAMIRHITGDMLTHLGYTAELTGDPVEATNMLRKASRQDQPFDAVLLDLNIPGHQGVAITLEAFRQAAPKCQIILTSGHSASRLKMEAEVGQCGACIPKPYNLEQLAAVLQDCLYPGDKNSPRK